MVTPSSAEPSSEMVGVVNEPFLEEKVSHVQLISGEQRVKTYCSLVFWTPESEKETFLACRSISLKTGTLAEPMLIDVSMSSITTQK